MKYNPPDGIIMIAMFNGKAAGCVALRKIWNKNRVTEKKLRPNDSISRLINRVRKADNVQSIIPAITEG